MNYDQYSSIHSFLLSHGQQELAGHLDNLWQTYGGEKVSGDPDEVKIEEGQTPEETVLKGRGDGLDN